jgi:galactose oxidase-like protein/glyoxal oxidase-like protein
MQGTRKILLTGLGTTQLLLVACQDTSQSPQLRPEPPIAETPGGSSLAPLDLVYVCGNKYLATNKTRSAVQVEYRVAGTKESGILLLREGPGGDPGFSETELETKNKGVLELYRDGERVARRSNGDLPCGAPAVSASMTAVGNEATVGKWSTPFYWPIIAVHLHLLRNGKVLSWGKFLDAQIWNPATKTFTPVPAPVNVFCSGHTDLPDGQLLVSGGHISDDQGLNTTTVFNPGTPAWLTKAPMARGRWYPTVTALANGQAVVIGGNDANFTANPIPEVWTGSSWRQLTTASRTVAYYPRTFLAPNGSVFYAGEGQGTYYLSTSGTGSWTWVANRLYGVRDYGSAVMYQPGKILYVGGGYTTNTAEVIDLNQPAPTWQWTNPMAYARRHSNATILPDGTVLVTGGTSGNSTFSDEANAVYAAELWNPTTGTWTTLASNSVSRVYHSTTLLLKDGRVLHTGSGDASGAINHYDAELFSPPYLFKGPRPQLTQAPTQVYYAQGFFLATPDPNAISRVTIIRLGSVTHAFDMNQRFNELTFTPAAGGLNVSPPTDPNLAPPGQYMVFILNATGVPSAGRLFRLR